jgi:hypothetical protein
MKLKKNMKKDNGIVYSSHEKGIGLIIIVMVLAFLLTIGIGLMTVTRTGPAVSGNIRLQDQAFNAAEAGFDAAWVTIEDYFASGAWTNFAGRYLKDPPGIDNPTDAYYYRRYTDEELLQIFDSDGDGMADYDNVIFYKQPFIPASSGGLDPRYTYTVFLVDDEVGGGQPDSSDALLVCIGVVQVGSNMTTSRIEVELAVDISGT